MAPHGCWFTSYNRMRRIVEPSQGTILIDGIDVMKIGLANREFPWLLPFLLSDVLLSSECYQYHSSRTATI